MAERNPDIHSESGAPSSDALGRISQRTMHELPFSLVLADAQLPDYPLIYVNPAFERITGYHRDAILGRNCRFLQGEETSSEDRERIRKALKSGEEVTIDILNYRANGDRFVNRLMIAPLRDDEGTVTHFLGIQNERDSDTGFARRALELDGALREVQHRVKNHLALLLALIRMEARRATDAKTALGVLANRVEALNVLYDEFSRSGRIESSTVALGAYVSRVCGALNMLDGRSEVRMNLETDEIRASVDAASQVGLLVSELLTNALQHAFRSNDGGLIEVRLWSADENGGTVCLQVRDDGDGLPAGSDWPREGNLGARIVRELSDRLEAEIEVKSGGDGTEVTISIPLSAIRP